MIAADPDAKLTASRWSEGYRSRCPVRIRAAVVSRENAVSLWVPLVPLIRSITFATLLVELVVDRGVPGGTEGYRGVPPSTDLPVPLVPHVHRQSARTPSRPGAPSTPPNRESARCP